MLFVLLQGYKKLGIVLENVFPSLRRKFWEKIKSATQNFTRSLNHNHWGSYAISASQSW